MHVTKTTLLGSELSIGLLLLPSRFFLHGYQTYHAAYFFFFTIFSHFYVPSMSLISALHVTQYRGSSPDNPLSVKSCVMLSIHLSFGLPRHIHRHPSFTHLFAFSCHCMSVLLLPTLLEYLILWWCKCDFTHPSQHPHFRPSKCILLRFLRCSRIITVYVKVGGMKCAEI